MSGEPEEGSLVPSSLKRVTGLRKGTEWSERRVGDGAGLNAGLTRGLALLFHGGAGAQSWPARRGGAARVAEARARGPHGGRLAARAVGEAQLPGTRALHFPGPGAPCRQAAPACHTRQQAPGGPCRDKSCAESGLAGPQPW